MLRKHLNESKLSNKIPPFGCLVGGDKLLRETKKIISFIRYCLRRRRWWRHYSITANQTSHSKCSVEWIDQWVLRFDKISCSFRWQVITSINWISNNLFANYCRNAPLRSSIQLIRRKSSKTTKIYGNCFLFPSNFPRNLLPQLQTNRVKFNWP